MFWNGRDDEVPVVTTAPRNRRRRMSALKWVLVVVFFPVTGSLAILAGAYVVARWSLVKERRAACAPGWLFVIAAITWWLLPSPEWWWALTGVALDVSTLPKPAAWWDRMRRTVVSQRERQLLARTCAGIALVMAFIGPAPFLPRALFLAAAVLAGSYFWWQGRRIRPHNRPPILDRWDNEVVPDLPQLAGQWLEFDEERGTGVLELANAKASAVADLDEDVERTLNQHRGTVTIVPDPRLTVRQVRVAFTDREYGSRLRLFDGSTLERGGRFVVGYAKGAVPIYGRLWSERGGIYIGVIAPPGSGKGSIMRLLAITGALSDRIELFGACGKRGAGIGYLAPAFRVFTKRHEESVDLIHGYLQVVRERADRFGNDDQDSFIPTATDPYLMLMIDEIQWIYEAEPRVIGWIEEITGTSRSTGCGLAMTMHKGDGPGWGTTKIRSNAIDNGWRWMGPATDNQARSTGLQGSDFDPSTLPDEPGWAGVLGSVLSGQPVMAARTLWVPNHADLELHRHLHDPDVTPEEFAPFGFVEDWLTKTVHPELHPATLAALDTKDPMQEFRRRQAAKAAGEAAADAGEVEAGEGVDLTPAPSDAWEKIRTVLDNAPAEGLLRGQIAEKAGVTPRHTSDTLNARAQKGIVIKDEKSRWRLAS